MDHQHDGRIERQAERGVAGDAHRVDALLLPDPAEAHEPVGRRQAGLEVRCDPGADRDAVAERGGGGARDVVGVRVVRILREVVDVDRREELEIGAVAAHDREPREGADAELGRRAGQRRSDVDRVRGAGQHEPGLERDATRQAEPDAGDVRHLERRREPITDADREREPFRPLGRGRGRGRGRGLGLGAHLARRLGRLGRLGRLRRLLGWRRWRRGLLLGRRRGPGTRLGQRGRARQHADRHERDPDLHSPPSSNTGIGGWQTGPHTSSIVAHVSLPETHATHSSEIWVGALALQSATHRFWSAGSGASTHAQIAVHATVARSS